MQIATAIVSDNKVQNVRLRGSPAAAEYNGKLYCFYQGDNNNSELRYCTFDGTTWSEDKQVEGVGISNSPAAVKYNGNLYCFHQGDNNNGQLWYSTFDGRNWAQDTRVQNVRLRGSPAAAEYNGKLYCFYQGDNNNGQLWYCTFDGKTWTRDTPVPNMSLSGSPAVTYYNEKIYVFYQGSVDNNALLYISFDGNKWDDHDTLIPNVKTLSPPALISIRYEGLVCFHRGIGDTISDFTFGKWVDEQRLDVGTSGTLAVVDYRQQMCIYCFYPSSVDKSSLLYFLIPYR